jgi:hypothetical protein
MSMKANGEFSPIEQEVIVLKAIWELIDDMVNYTMFTKLTDTADVTLNFNSSTHQRLFNILLGDLLSLPGGNPLGLPTPPPGTLASERSLFFHLKRVCADPKLNAEGNDLLRTPLDAFLEWLETECVVTDVWLPSIELQIDIKVKRVFFLKICGNIAKHGFTRLGVNVGDICDLLHTNGATVDREQGFLVIPEFYEWFHTNLFSYHSSAIAEFLNNIRWGIYDYLRPEFMRSFTRDDPNSIAYRFVYPLDCNRPVAQTMYWDLMNEMRSAPYIPRFEVTRYLKMRY